MGEWTPTMHVYANLLSQWGHAKRAGDDAKAERIFAATNVFIELWPEDVKRFEDLFGDKRSE